MIEIDEHPELGQVLLRQWLDLHFYRAVGERTLPLETVWFKYLRRFGVDQWYRFAFTTIALDIA